MPVIPATQEADAEDYKFKASLGNLVRPCLKVIVKKYWGCDLSGRVLS
jgi:hypothetical protein